MDSKTNVPIKDNRRNNNNNPTPKQNQQGNNTQTPINRNTENPNHATVNLPTEEHWERAAEVASNAIEEARDFINSGAWGQMQFPTQDTKDNKKLYALENDRNDDWHFNEAYKAVLSSQPKWTVDEFKTFTQNHPDFPEQLDNFQIITKKMHDTYIAKNHDYGASFDKTWEQYGITSLLIRLSDKMNRLSTLANNSQPLVQNESIQDTLLDLANYAILGILKLQQ